MSRNSAASPTAEGGGHARAACPDRRRTTGFNCIHSAVDDYSRLAHSEVHPDEKAATCAAFLQRAAAFFANCGAAGKLTRAYRPQTNGKVEPFNRTLLDEWACPRPCTSNNERTRRPDRHPAHLQPPPLS